MVKKILALSLILMIMASCGNSSIPDYTELSATYDDKTICYGMSREDVEKVVAGLPDSNSVYLNDGKTPTEHYYTADMRVSFENDKVCAIVIRGGEWKTHNNIRIGSILNEVLAVF